LSPGWFQTVCERWPGRVVLGIDARDGRVATEGWLEVSEISALELARRCTAAPLAAIVYTDISRDGMLLGANVQVMAAMAAAVAVPVIASGGVTTLDDIRHLMWRAVECGLRNHRDNLSNHSPLFICSQEKGSGTICAKHPKGRSGKWCLTPFPASFRNPRG
jgi:hypothetical protein